jgi:hypothetical protein
MNDDTAHLAAGTFMAYMLGSLNVPTAAVATRDSRRTASERSRQHFEFGLELLLTGLRSRISGEQADSRSTGGVMEPNDQEIEERDGLKIETLKLIDHYDREVGRLTTPRKVNMLRVLLDHVAAMLVDHDIDRLMETMVPEPYFRFYGTDGMPHLDGHAEVRDFFVASFETGPDTATMVVSEIIVDDDFIVQEGYSLMTGSRAVNLFPELSAPVDPDRPSILRKRLCVVFSFDDERIAGANLYFDGPYRPSDIVYLD